MVNGRNRKKKQSRNPHDEALKTCYGFQRFVNGPYQSRGSGACQGIHSFSCTRAALATSPYVYGIAAQNNFLE